MIDLTGQPLDVAALVEAVGDPEHGGIATFLGTTRRDGAGRVVVALDYEAYEELAVAEMRAIAQEAEDRFAARVAVSHRVGRVDVGQPSVAVAASAGHRPEAFAACRYVIDELKSRAPIWKRTLYADGDATWIDGRAAPGRAPAGTR